MTTVISILGGSLYRSIRRLPHAGDGNAVILCVPYRATAEKTGEDQTVSLDHDLRYATKAEWNAGVEQYEAQRRCTSQVSSPSNAVVAEITARSSAAQKIQLFRSLFHGRDDVYAYGFLSKKTGKVGYAPAAWNEWMTLPNGKRVPTPSDQRRCKPLTDQVLLDHFTKRDSQFHNVVGLYPLSKDSKVWFLAIDFDDDGWKEEIIVTKRVCENHGLHPIMERSHSGDGGHLWMFFSEEIEAAQARKMGTALLSEAAQKTHIRFRSYDRMFPNQDLLPSGGFGNLIALPLQRLDRDAGNSVFVDEQFNPYADQWAFLDSVQRITAQQVNAIATLASANTGPLGNLAKFDSPIPHAVGQKKETDKQAPTTGNGSLRTGSRTPPSNADVPETITIIERSMLEISKTNLTPLAQNAVRRLAAFANPDRAQAMRQPVYNKPRIIYCGEETVDSILLPRGCRESVAALLTDAGCTVTFDDERNQGKRIRVKFIGSLRAPQSEAAKTMLEYDDGILVAPTGFGKTVIAADLIAKRKTNTLIIIRSSSLMEQWRDRLEQFLTVKAKLPPLLTPTGRIIRRQHRYGHELCRDTSQGYCRLRTFPDYLG